jgi:hypothetical protein
MNRSVPAITIEQKIFLIRGQKVMLDSDLAELYDVPTKALIQAVKRNRERFPGDFAFLLTNKEVTILRSQIVTSSWGGRRHLPYVFTEQGVAMLSSVLNSDRAILVNIAIMRAFVKLREVMLLDKELSHKLDQLESKVERHDEDIAAIFEAIRELMAPPPPKPKPEIGFHTKYD